MAADKLNVTQAAVSQQVKALEAHLGVPLILRVGRGIELTAPGARLAREIGTGFDLIARGVERLCEDSAKRPVQVTMSPAFAVEWLLPRINEFQQSHPEITLMLNPTSRMVDIEPGGIDVAIRYRDTRLAPPHAKAVLVTDMIVVGAASLVGDARPGHPEALATYPWLQELGTNEAADWFTYHGVIPNTPLTVNHMPGNLIMTAVRRGDGITYSARAFFEDDLRAGRMVELFSETLFGVYYIETQGAHQRAEAQTFVRWLMSKADTVTTKSG